MIEKLNHYGVKAIGLNIIFSSPSNFPAADQHLQKVLQAAKNTVIASVFQFSYAGAVSYREPFFHDVRYGVSSFTSLNGLKQLSQSQLLFDLLDFSSDASQVETRTYEPNLDLELLKIVAPQRAQKLAEKYRDQLLDVKFSGPAQTYQHISLYLISQLNEGLSEAEFKTLTGHSARTWLKNKIILIGASDPILQDIRDTMAGKMSSTEILANFLDTLRTLPLN